MNGRSEEWGPLLALVPLLEGDIQHRKEGQGREGERKGEEGEERRRGEKRERKRRGGAGESRTRM